MTKLELFTDEQQKLATLFKAFAHPARVAILQYLASSATCMSGDITNELPLSRTTVQQHLQELKSAGIIQGQIEGVRTNYCINPTVLMNVRSLIGEYMDALLKSGSNTCKHE